MDPMCAKSYTSHCIPTKIVINLMLYKRALISNKRKCSGQLEPPQLLFFTFSIAIFLMSCSSITPKNYQANQPKLDIRDYLNGEVKAWGMLENRSGEVTRRFVVDMQGTWQGGKR